MTGRACEGGHQFPARRGRYRLMGAETNAIDRSE